MRLQWMRCASMVAAGMVILSAAAIPASAEETVTMNKAISYTGEELNDPIDGMWQCMRENNDKGGALESAQEGITGDGKTLKLAGYQSGGNTQYAYTDMNAFHNKIIKTKMKFEGELPSIDGSFIAFVFRAEGYSSKFFWDTGSYSIILKSGAIEVQKHPAKYQGKDNNLGGTKGKTPIVVKLDTPFKAGTYDIEMGAVDGKSPKTGKDAVNIIFRLNGKELVNVWDDSERTPCITRKGYFMVCPIATQKDVEDETKTQSKSSISFMQVSETPGKTDDNKPKNTTTRANAVPTTKAQPGKDSTSAAQKTTENTLSSQTEDAGVTGDTTSELNSQTTAAVPVGGEPDSSAPSGAQKGGLGTGAIVGIVAAVVVVLAGGGAAVYFFIIRKKK